LHFDFCFQQNAYGGWGRGLKDTGRGSQEEIAEIAKIENHSLNHKVHEGTQRKTARIAFIPPQPGKNSPIWGR